jgi:beta-N-acetylhexosaminidase
MERPVLAAMLSCKGESLSDDEKRLFSESNPLGVSLFIRNMKNEKQIKKLINDIKNAINRDDILIAIDEEGGRVSRLSQCGLGQYASAEVLSECPVKYAVMQAELSAIQMRNLGINVNYAPVVDIKTHPQSSVLESRCFSDNVSEIIKYASAIAQTYTDNAICPCIKHIPGHFLSLNDPHLSSIRINIPKSEILNTIAYLKEFKKFPMWMTAHTVLETIDNMHPVTISPKCISEIIRGELEYDGFLISDAIDMHALSGNIVQKALQSLAAGVDAVCYCGGDFSNLYALCQEKKFMTEKSLIRFAKIKKVLHNKPKVIDVSYTEHLYQVGLKNKLDVKYNYDATEVLHQMLKKGNV